jgi:hypothetical protein
MKKRYRLVCPGIRGGKFYCVDSATGKRKSLNTSNEEEAEQIVAAKNQALRQPALNLQIVRVNIMPSRACYCGENTYSIHIRQIIR